MVQFIQGSLRVNLKKPSDAYVPGGKLSTNDVIVLGMINRNRALDSDQVVVALEPKTAWVILEQDIEEQHVLSSIVLGAAHEQQSERVSPNSQQVCSHTFTSDEEENSDNALETSAALDSQFALN